MISRSSRYSVKEFDLKINSVLNFKALKINVPLNAYNLV